MPVPGQELSHVLDIDHALAEIEREIDPLLNVTPVNAAEAWLDFERSGFDQVPSLRSRPLDFEPDLVRRRLYGLEIERVEDPALSNLFREKRDEIARQITMLEDRDTSRFVYGSLQVFGEVGDQLVTDAEKLLRVITPEVPHDERVTASAFAERAEKELQRYRNHHPGFRSTLEIRTDVADLMVSHGCLLVPEAATFRRSRVEALIQHEIGTHVVTYENGRAQRLRLLSVGLPGYDETQEGLAVLAEFAIGGLDPLRMRLLAARVVAVDRMLTGASFLDIFGELKETYSFSAKTAWSVTMRTMRCGGMTKDVVYLRGISRVLEFVSERKTIEPLLVGKLSLEHVPLVEELIESGFLTDPRVRPRWTEGRESQERLARVYEGMSVHDLVADVLAR
jgi:uncharacterized protein (TIGR02421 family)